jgi:CheY-like chemotaxis protein
MMQTPLPSGNQQIGQCRVLVVDDYADSADTLSMMLRLKGNEVQTCYNGMDGVTAGETFQPNVIILDIGMPGLNGYDTCKLIRQQSWGKSVTIYALTGYGQADDRLKSREAGFDAHLLKPVDLEELIDLLQKAV